MKSTDGLLEWAAEYEKNCGERPSAALVGFFSHAMGNETKRGMKCAKQNQPKDDDSKFRMFGNIGFPDDPAMAEVSARILKHCYMDGYEVVRKSREMEVSA